MEDKINEVKEYLKDTPYSFVNIRKESGRLIVELFNNLSGEVRYQRLERLKDGMFPDRLYSNEDHRLLDKLVKDTGKFLEGTRFTQNCSRTSCKKRLDMYCPKCSNDIYVKKGLCDGVFKCRRDNVINGKLPCRCSGHYTWDVDQRVFQVKNHCDDIGYEFIDFLPRVNGKFHKVVYRCNKGHKREVWMNGFLYQGQRCKLCSNDAYNSSGYYPDRDEDPDYLYIAEFNDYERKERFIKIGRSFHPETRLNYYPKNYSVRYINIVQDSHKNVYNLEQNLQGRCNEYHYTPLTKFGGSVKECFKVDCLNDLDDYLKTNT